MRDLIGRRFHFERTSQASQEGLIPIKELPSRTWFHVDGSIQPDFDFQMEPDSGTARSCLSPGYFDDVSADRSIRHVARSPRLDELDGCSTDDDQ